MHRIRVVIACGLVSCALTEPIEPGPGRVGGGAKERHATQRDQGLRDAARRAGAVADQRPSDTRMQRKAVALSKHALVERVAESEEVLAWTEGALDRLQSDCATRAEAAELYIRAKEYGPAGNAYARSARECGDVDAALAATMPLRQAGRCDEAIDLLRDAWARCPSDQQVALLDRVSSCSTPLNFFDNVSFAPPHVVDAYLALLDRRERDRIAQERAYERQRRAEQAEAAAQEARWDCESECNQAGSQCRGGCGGNAACFSRCDAFASGCRAHCQ